MSRSARATEAAGAAFARTLVPGDCVRLLGPLGAGKTTFVRGALRALRVAEAASSPTFVLAHEAWGRTRGGVRVRVAHLDCYRLAAGAAEGRGLLDYLDGRAIVFVEWADRDPAFRVPGARTVRFRRQRGGARRIALSG